MGFHSDQTSFQSSALYLWALGKICFVKMSSSTLCCTVFLSNVFASVHGRNPTGEDRCIYVLYIQRVCSVLPWFYTSKKKMRASKNSLPQPIANLEITNITNFREQTYWYSMLCTTFILTFKTYWYGVYNFYTYVYSLKQT